MDITNISEELIQQGTFKLDKLEGITVPVRLPVKCDLVFNAARMASGPRILVNVNGEKAGVITFSGENGIKETHIDISELLLPGANELRCRCLVANDAMSMSPDEAVISIRSEGTSVIRKVFKTPSTIEPFDQIWTLRVIKS